MRSILTSILLVSCFAWAVFAEAQLTAGSGDPIRLPNGLAITPNAAPRSVLTALNPGMPGRRDLTLGQGVTPAFSPDGATLLVLPSGYNKKGPQKSDESVFVFDETAYPPRQIQA